MARIPITPERYQLFVDAFLQLGPRINAVASRVGCDPQTAKRAWQVGWDGYAPIHILYAEMLKRRRGNALPPVSTEVPAPPTSGPQNNVTGISVSPTETSGLGASKPPGHLGGIAASDLRQAALAALESEVRTLADMRESIGRAFKVTDKVLTGFDKICASVLEHMELVASNVAGATPESILAPLQKFAELMGTLTETYERVMRMQRLLVGAPQAITEARGVQASGEGTSSGERLARILEIMRSNGLATATGQTPARAYAGEESQATQPVPGDLIPPYPPVS